MIYGYVRVSTQDQSIDSQKNSISRHCIDQKLMVDEWIELEMSSRKSAAQRRIDELMATKLPVLYQRRKGRDLFDVWYVAKQKLINLNRVFEIYSKYCTHDNTHIRGEDFWKNLALN